MTTTFSSGPGDPGWAPGDACTLPTVDQPLRLAEFDDLFRSALETIERSGGTRARLILAGGSGLADRVQGLAESESSCCSLFTFSVAPIAKERVMLDIEVPAAYTDVLAALVARAEASKGEES